MKGRNLPSQNQAGMIYKDLRESYSLPQGRTPGDGLNILRLAIDVLNIFQLSGVYQMKMYAGS